MKSMFVPMTILVLASGHALAQSAVPKQPAMPMPTQTQMQSHTHMPAPNLMQMQNQLPMAPGAAAALADGEVRKIEKDAGKITLKHGPIASLDMPPMTMVFKAMDGALLDKVKVGDKVRFAAEQSGGVLTVTAIEPAK